jgi:hypothetical protein
MKLVCSRVVQRRHVPEEKVRRPERQGDQRVGEDPQPVEDRDLEDRLQQRPGQAEDQQQGGDVAEQQVLGHVRDHQLLADVGDRRGQGDDDHQQAAGKTGLAPERHRPSPGGEGRGALRVEGRGNQHRQQLERGEVGADMRERQAHRRLSVAPRAPSPGRIHC